MDTGWLGAEYPQTTGPCTGCLPTRAEHVCVVDQKLVGRTLPASAGHGRSGACPHGGQLPSVLTDRGHQSGELPRVVACPQPPVLSVAHKIQWTTARGRDNRYPAAEGFLDHLAERLRRAGMYQNVKAGDDARQVLVTTSTEEPRTRHGPGKRCLPRSVADDRQPHARYAS